MYEGNVSKLTEDVHASQPHRILLNEETVYSVADAEVSDGAERALQRLPLFQGVAPRLVTLRSLMLAGADIHLALVFLLLFVASFPRALPEAI